MASGGWTQTIGLAFACPHCRSLLTFRAAGDALSCMSCDARYPVVEDVPVLVDHADAHKAMQADYTDHSVDEEWEITRPHGAPALYAWLLEEKFRRGTRKLPVAPGSSVLIVCGGSGLDAELLARMGAAVVCSDISLEAAKRTRERARRYGVPIVAIVADAERLPFADASFDVVYVHDGLHHLENPLAGLDEMVRVARRAVSVNEPARAVATNIAMRLGVSLEREEAGNRVARLEVPELSDALGRHGFRTVEARRYAMFYRHAPGPFMRSFSRKWTFPLARAALSAFNAFAGRIGNKLTVQAVRDRAV